MDTETQGKVMYDCEYHWPDFKADELKEGQRKEDWTAWKRKG